MLAAWSHWGAFANPRDVELAVAPGFFKKYWSLVVIFYFLIVLVFNSLIVIVIGIGIIFAIAIIANSVTINNTKQLII